MGLKDVVRKVIPYLPEIKMPDHPPSLKERLGWVLFGITIYFIMYNTPAYGVILPETNLMEFLSVVTASRIGTLLTLGIGPIVMASIFLQLFNGAGIFEFNLEEPEERRVFFATQKILAIILALVEAYLFVAFQRVPTQEGMGFIVMLQIAFGSIILLYLDELITKYGIGSGISLFIAAGVSYQVLGGLFGNLIFGDNGVVEILASGGADALSRALLALTPFYSTIIVFVIVVYAEGMKIEIPLSFQHARGAAGRLPIKFLYVSNIPVILTAALMMNLMLFGSMLPAYNSPEEAKGILPYFAYVENTDRGPRVADGLLYLITPMYAPHDSSLLSFLASLPYRKTPYFGIPEILHVIISSIVFILCCVMFGVFWVETANMGPDAVAKQLMSSGLMIPGHRRDPRMIKRILEKYLPVVVKLGSGFVGFLAVLANLTGALGTGTGILLTVTILHRFYEQLMSMKVFDLYPTLGKIFGK